MVALTDPYLKRLAEIESSANPMAQNPNSSAKGLFQFIDSTAKQYGINAPFGTPEYTQQELAAAQKFTEDNRRVLAQALGREPSAGELYLAHQQGAGGALKLLTNPNTPAAQLVGVDAVKLNRGNENMTAQDFANQWINKFEGSQGQDTMIGGQGQDSIDFVQIETPDGIVEFPSSMADSEIEAALQRLYPPQEVQSVETQPQDFWQRMGSDLSKRGGNVWESISTNALNQQTTPEALAQILGQGIALGGDVLGNLAISGYRALPESVQSGLGSIPKAIGKLPSYGGGTIGERIPQELGQLLQQYGDFAEENPRADRNLRALGNIASVLPVTKSTKLSKVAGKVEDVGSQIKKQADNVIPKVKNLTSDDLARESAKAYKNASQVGGDLPNDFVDDWVSDITKRITPKTTQAKIIAGKNPEIDDILERINSLPRQPTSLEAFDEMDKWLGQKARDNFEVTTGSFNNTGRQIKEMQDALRETVENIDPAKLNKEGYEALKNARSLWSRKIRLRELEDIALRAEMTQNPAVSIKNSLKNLRLNKKKMAGYSEAEKAAIEKAAKTGILEDLIRPLTSRLPAIGGMAIGEPTTATIMNLGGMGARGIKDELALQQLGKIGQMVAGKTTPLPAPQGAYGLRAVGSGIERTGKTLGQLGRMRAPQLTAVDLIKSQFEQEQQ